MLSTSVLIRAIRIGSSVALNIRRQPVVVVRVAAVSGDMPSLSTTVACRQVHWSAETRYPGPIVEATVRFLLGIIPVFFLMLHLFFYDFPDFVGKVSVFFLSFFHAFILTLLLLEFF